MDIKRHRPININPLSIRLPLPALISITHRLSGFFLFLCLPALLWILNMSLESQHNFNVLQNIFKNFYIKILIWLALAAFIFHLLAGIRHLMTDFRIGISLRGAHLTGWAILILFFGCIAFLAVYLGGWF